MSTFPKTLHVTKGGNGTDDTPDYFGKESLEGMNDGDGAFDGEVVAIYELVGVKRVELTRKLVDEG